MRQVFSFLIARLVLCSPVFFVVNLAQYNWYWYLVFCVLNIFWLCSGDFGVYVQIALAEKIYCEGETDECLKV